MGLDAVEIMMAWEESFGVDLLDGETARIRTPRVAVELICRKLGVSDELSPSGWTHEKVRAVVREIIEEKLGITDFLDDADFEYDLGVG